jgi:hypothetical protein
MNLRDEPSLRRASPRELHEDAPDCEENLAMQALANLRTIGARRKSAYGFEAVVKVSTLGVDLVNRSGCTSAHDLRISYLFCNVLLRSR